jgi:ribulose-phosphate 3-epimerase
MSQRIRTVPAILTNSPEALKKMAELTETFTGYAQFDIMDGQFVPSQSVSCADIAALKTRLTWEAHLMVLHPEDCLEAFRQAGAQRIVFHYEATPIPENIIVKIREQGMKAGLAVNPETPISAITHLVDKLDGVLFLSVNPGFYGARFIPEVLEKISAFRKAYPEMEIGIDGGIKEDNIVEIARTGVNIICIGSAVYSQPDPAASYRRLTALVEGAVPG